MSNTKAIAGSYVGVLAFAGVIFLAAGRLIYWPGIVYVITALVGTTMSHLLVPRGSDLTAARASEAGAGASWDKRLLGGMFLASMIGFVVAGLDSGRFGWTGALPMSVTITGVLLMVAGQLLFALAKRENRFFSSTARVQHERGHQVCDTGLYRVVRHPGYLGMLLSQLAFPLVLGSVWAFVPTVIGAALLVVRTQLEDRLLAAELPGYREYSAKTKWRLVPGVY